MTIDAPSSPSRWYRFSVFAACIVSGVSGFVLPTPNPAAPEQWWDPIMGLIFLYAFIGVLDIIGVIDRLMGVFHRKERRS